MCVWLHADPWIFLYRPNAITFCLNCQYQHLMYARMRIDRGLNKEHFTWWQRIGEPRAENGDFDVKNPLTAR